MIYKIKIGKMIMYCGEDTLRKFDEAMKAEAVKIESAMTEVEKIFKNKNLKVKDNE